MTIELQPTAPLLRLATAGAIGGTIVSALALLISTGAFRWSAFLAVAAVAAWAALVDARTRRLPNTILAILTGITLSITIVSAWTTSSAVPLVQAGVGAGILGGIYLGMGLLGWVGFGDVKLAAILGAYLGTVAIAAAPAAAWVAILLAGVQQLAARARSRTDRPGRLPHGPALVSAAVLIGGIWQAVTG